MKIDRRETMLGFASALGGALMAAPASAGAHSPMAPAKDKSKHVMAPLQKFLRIRCSTYQKPTYWWYSGQIMGYVEGLSPLQPILSVVGASQTVASENSDGSISYDMVEAGYYGDPASGDIADGPISNLLNGEQITPKHYLSPQKLRFTNDLRVEPASGPLPPDVSFEGKIVGPDEKGDRIWMAEQLIAEIAARGDRPKRISNSLANFQASLSDVMSDRQFVPATMDYTTLNSFRPWMNMGSASGRIMSRLQAIKLERWSSVPVQLRQRIEADHSGVFGNV
jgi:hypothetical protein